MACIYGLYGSVYGILCAIYGCVVLVSGTIHGAINGTIYDVGLVKSGWTLM